MPLALAPRIIVDPAIRSGKPVIEGTRVPVALVLGKLAGGMSQEEVTREYDLTADDIRAVLAYAAGLLANEEVRATGPATPAPACDRYPVRA